MISRLYLSHGGRCASTEKWDVWCTADLRTLAKLIPAESRLVIEPPKKAEQPQKALEVVGVPTSSIRQGDVLRVLPGERVPVDGEILEGRCSLDESMLTGESALVNKAEGAQVSAQACDMRTPSLKDGEPWLRKTLCRNAPGC